MIMKKGFTIIESIVAIGIFGVGVLAIVGFYAVSSQAVRNARQITTATFLAQGLIESTISNPYDSLVIGAGLKEPFTTDQANPAFGYQKKIDITQIDQNLATSAQDLGLKKIDIYVYWQGVTSEKQVHFTTIKTQI